MAHLTSNATASLFRSLAWQAETSGGGIRILAWRRVAFIIETRKQPKRLLAVDRQIPVDEVFDTNSSAGEQQ